MTADKRRRVDMIGQIRLRPNMLGQLEKLAASEDRTVPGVVRLLISEGLQRRGMTAGTSADRATNIGA
jgi:hypothetical protein